MDMNLTTGDTRLIIDTCKEYGCLRNQAAYILATTWHETGGYMRPIKETVMPHHSNKNPSDATVISRLDNAWKAGRLGSVKTPYWRSGWFGRGYAQITHEVNYQNAQGKTGLPFHDKPETALQPKPAAIALVRGSMEGWFTGKKLSDYITLQKSDFKGARRVINGKDRAAKIAGYAREYDVLLKAEGYGEENEQPRSSVAVPNPNPITKSRTAGGAGAAGIGGGALAIKETMDIIETQKDSLTAGDFVTLIVSLVIVGFALWALYARLDDGGYLPWSKGK